MVYDVLDISKFIGTKFYKNCKSQRKRNAKICQDCPLKILIEFLENNKRHLVVSVSNID